MLRLGARFEAKFVAAVLVLAPAILAPARTFQSRAATRRVASHRELDRHLGLVDPVAPPAVQRQHPGFVAVDRARPPRPVLLRCLVKLVRHVRAAEHHPADEQTEPHREDAEDGGGGIVALEGPFQRHAAVAPDAREAATRLRAHTEAGTNAQRMPHQRRQSEGNSFT